MDHAVLAKALVAVQQRRNKMEGISLLRSAAAAYSTPHTTGSSSGLGSAEQLWGKNGKRHHGLLGGAGHDLAASLHLHGRQRSDGTTSRNWRARKAIIRSRRKGSAPVVTKTIGQLRDAQEDDVETSRNMPRSRLRRMARFTQERQWAVQQQAPSPPTGSGSKKTSNRGLTHQRVNSLAENVFQTNDQSTSTSPTAAATNGLQALLKGSDAVKILMELSKAPKRTKRGGKQMREKRAAALEKKLANKESVAQKDETNSPSSSAKEAMNREPIVTTTEEPAAMNAATKSAATEQQQPEAGSAISTREKYDSPNPLLRDVNKNKLHQMHQEQLLKAREVASSSPSDIRRAIAMRNAELLEQGILPSNEKQVLSSTRSVLAKETIDQRIRDADEKAANAILEKLLTTHRLTGGRSSSLMATDEDVRVSSAQTETSSAAPKSKEKQDASMALGEVLKEASATKADGDVTSSPAAVQGMDESQRPDDLFIENEETRERLLAAEVEEEQLHVLASLWVALERTTVSHNELSDSVTQHVRAVMHHLIDSKMYIRAISLYHLLCDVGLHLRQADLKLLLSNLMYDRAKDNAAAHSHHTSHLEDGDDVFGKHDIMDEERERHVAALREKRARAVRTEQEQKGSGNEKAQLIDELMKGFKKNKAPTTVSADAATSAEAADASSSTSTPKTGPVVPTELSRWLHYEKAMGNLDAFYEDCADDQDAKELKDGEAFAAGTTTSTSSSTQNESSITSPYVEDPNALARSRVLTAARQLSQDYGSWDVALSLVLASQKKLFMDKREHLLNSHEAIVDALMASVAPSNTNNLSAPHHAKPQTWAVALHCMFLLRKQLRQMSDKEYLELGTSREDCEHPSTDGTPQHQDLLWNLSSFDIAQQQQERLVSLVVGALGTQPKVFDAWWQDNAVLTAKALQSLHMHPDRSVLKLKADPELSTVVLPLTALRTSASWQLALKAIGSGRDVESEQPHGPILPVTSVARTETLLMVCRRLLQPNTHRLDELLQLPSASSPTTTKKHSSKKHHKNKGDSKQLVANDDKSVVVSPLSLRQFTKAMLVGSMCLKRAINERATFSDTFGSSLDGDVTPTSTDMFSSMKAIDGCIATSTAQLAEFGLLKDAFNHLTRFVYLHRRQAKQQNRWLPKETTSESPLAVPTMPEQVLTTIDAVFMNGATAAKDMLLNADSDKWRRREVAKFPTTHSPERGRRSHQKSIRLVRTFIVNTQHHQSAQPTQTAAKHTDTTPVAVTASLDFAHQFATAFLAIFPMPKDACSQGPLPPSMTMSNSSVAATARKRSVMLNCAWKTLEQIKTSILVSIEELNRLDALLASKKKASGVPATQQFQQQRNLLMDKVTAIQFQGVKVLKMLIFNLSAMSTIAPFSPSSCIADTASCHWSITTREKLRLRSYWRLFVVPNLKSVNVRLVDASGEKAGTEATSHVACGFTFVQREKLLEVFPHALRTQVYAQLGCKKSRCVKRLVSTSRKVTHDQLPLAASTAVPHIPSADRQPVDEEIGSSSSSAPTGAVASFSQFPPSSSSMHPASIASHTSFSDLRAQHQHPPVGDDQDGDYCSPTHILYHNRLSIQVGGQRAEIVPARSALHNGARAGINTTLSECTIHFEAPIDDQELETPPSMSVVGAMTNHRGLGGGGGSLRGSTPGSGGGSDSNDGSNFGGRSTWRHDYKGQKKLNETQAKWRAVSSVVRGAVNRAGYDTRRFSSELSQSLKLHHSGQAPGTMQSDTTKQASLATSMHWDETLKLFQLVIGKYKMFPSQANSTEKIDRRKRACVTEDVFKLGAQIVAAGHEDPWMHAIGLYWAAVDHSVPNAHAAKQQQQNNKNGKNGGDGSGLERPERRVLKSLATPLGLALAKSGQLAVLESMNRQLSEDNERSNKQQRTERTNRRGQQKKRDGLDLSFNVSELFNKPSHPNSKPKKVGGNHKNHNKKKQASERHGMVLHYTPSMHRTISDLLHNWRELNPNAQRGDSLGSKKVMNFKNLPKDLPGQQQPSTTPIVQQKRRDELEAMQRRAERQLHKMASSSSAPHKHHVAMMGGDDESEITLTLNRAPWWSTALDILQREVSERETHATTTALPMKGQYQIEDETLQETGLELLRVIRDSSGWELALRHLDATVPKAAVYLKKQSKTDQEKSELALLTEHDDHEVGSGANSDEASSTEAVSATTEVKRVHSAAVHRFYLSTTLTKIWQIRVQGEVARHMHSTYRDLHKELSAFTSQGSSSSNTGKAWDSSCDLLLMKHMARCHPKEHLWLRALDMARESLHLAARGSSKDSGCTHLQEVQTVDLSDGKTWSPAIKKSAHSSFQFNTHQEVIHWAIGACSRGGCWREAVLLCSCIGVKPPGTSPSFTKQQYLKHKKKQDRMVSNIKREASLKAIQIASKVGVTLNPLYELEMKLDATENDEGEGAASRLPSLTDIVVGDEQRETQ